MSKIRKEKFFKGNIIIREGSEVQCAYIINEGYVEVFKKLSKNEIKSLAKLGKGQLIGEMSLFGDKKSTASVRAITDLEVQVIDKEVFDYYISKTPPLIVVLLEILIKKLYKTSQRLAIETDSPDDNLRFKKSPDPNKVDFNEGKAKN